MIVYAISDAPKKKHVIASQSADWRGNPPGFFGIYVGDCNIYASPWEIATSLRSSQ